MDGGDFVTLIVSIITILFSVFGAHELARKQDKRKEVSELFVKIYGDLRVYQNRFNNYVTASLNAQHFKSTTMTAERLEQRKSELRHEAYEALLALVDIKADSKSHDFLLGLIVSTQHKTRITNKITALHRYGIKITNEWPKEPNKTPSVAMEHINNFDRLLGDIASEMADCFRELSHDDLSFA